MKSFMKKRNLICVDPTPPIPTNIINKRIHYQLQIRIVDNTSTKLILTLRHDIFQPIYRELQNVDFRDKR
ncbi:hypothetical protein UFOVP787_62 [uncultured Caudovirales phage]|uniref:Uncharacterized protein n=1 Tax=uncultured Caudovirales phage TaxID=2100421 RepID=A0A6J5NUB5_9CAUD|nr:hypothetical protein UFOVP787_62 [uncultured Caudovirales phage]